MATQKISPSHPAQRRTIAKVAEFSRLRVLAWDKDMLYASHGYTLLRAKISDDVGKVRWEQVGEFLPAWWRSITSTSTLTTRLCRDGFHALAISPTGSLIGAVPKAIVTLAPGASEFRVSHRILRGTRPLHFAVTQRGSIFWGEYFDNAERREVHIYGSSDGGEHWDVAYTFPEKAIRHVHNTVYDHLEDCLWVLTGDESQECRILRASCDFKNVDLVLAGNQQARAVALVVTPKALLFASDTPLEKNHVYRLDRRGNLTSLADLSGSSIYGCRVGQATFFSTMAEPSVVNNSREVCLYGNPDGTWKPLLHWKKDFWPMALFQYGNAFLPDGDNTSPYLAVTTVAVDRPDFETSLWRVG